MANDYRIFPLGDSALTVEFGRTISIDMNERAIALANALEKNPFPGFIESVPAYASATIFYDVVTVRKSSPNSVFQTVAAIVKQAITNQAVTTPDETRTIEIAVHFDKESSPDLAAVAQWSGKAEEKVIDIFLEREYRVFMLGFLPGFSYMGVVDERIAMPRKDTPRTLVPKGSVGIAGPQTGIYSLASPGGWQIIGRTEMEMFTPNDAAPSRLRSGNLVRFVKAGK